VNQSLADSPRNDQRASELQFLQLRPDAMAAFVRRGDSVPASFGERLRIIAMLGRPRTCVPNLLAYALGFSYTNASGSVRCLAGAILACCIGFAANIHNAAVELEEDSHNLPGRVLLVAKFGYRRVMLFWGLLVASMLATAIALGLYFAVFMALAIVGLHQYSAPPVRSKGRPILGLWVFAQTVVFPFLFGWTTEPGQMLETLLAAIGSAVTGSVGPAPELARQSFRYLGMWFFLTVWFMAKGTFKNVPDFEGDRAAAVHTSATACGTQRNAAIVAAFATILAYLTLVPLVALGLERPRALFALLWLGPVGANCVRLVRAADGKAANGVLRVDMRLSTAFLATLTLLVAPTASSLVMVAAAALLLFVSDLFGLDSRRDIDVTGGAAAARSRSAA
jgi:4-hydroxybenzoate polyprenyltransferase